MFADSLLEVSWAQRSRRGWTTLTSFGLQAALIGLLLLLPLWKTVGLPTARSVSVPIAVGRPHTEPGATHNQPHSGTSSTPPRGSVVVPFVQPGRIPTGHSTYPEDPEPQPPGGVCCGSDQASSGDLNGFPVAIGGTRSMPLPPPAPAPVVRQFRTSKMLEGSLVRREQPLYPPLAKAARVQGPVLLAAIISKTGTIEDLHVISGHPMLVAAAIEAVRQWRYRPYVLNGEPVEVETQITVNFTLSGS